MAQKPKAHRVPCGTWESTEADIHVLFIIQKFKIKVLSNHTITITKSQKGFSMCKKGFLYNIIPY